jgi:hypothetical protein
MTESDDAGAFAARHIGPSPREIATMLAALGVASLDELVDRAVPDAIRDRAPLALRRAVWPRCFGTPHIDWLPRVFRRSCCSSPDCRLVWLSRAQEECVLTRTLPGGTTRHNRMHEAFDPRTRRFYRRVFDACGE